MTQAHRLFRIVLVITALIDAPPVQAADVSPEQYQHYLNRRWEERVLRMRPPEPSQREPPTIKRGDRLPISSAPSIGSDGRMTVKPRDARPLVTAPASGKATEDHSYLIPLLLIVLAMIGLLWIIGSLPRLARGIDRLFEPSTGEASREEPVFIHINDAPPVDAPAPSHESEVAAMRAMKEQLEAQAAAARAAIEEALARANKDQKEDAA